MNSVALSAVDGLRAATKQFISFYKVGGATRGTDSWVTHFDIAGSPGAGTLSVGNTAAGTVPTSATAGFPPITAFAAGATGYLACVNFGAAAVCRYRLFDCLFRAGAYAFNANTTLAAQPSYSARLPNGSYAETQLWFEAVTLFTGTPVVTVTYTNQAGVAGRTTGAITLASAFKLGRLQQLPLQAGDTGIQKIDSVTCATASVGTFNLLVFRPLWSGRIDLATQYVNDFTETGLPVVFADSALYLISNPFTSGNAEVDVSIVIASA